jgi:hypothetical protein
MRETYYRGVEPCPACGVTGKEKPRWGGPKSICGDCKKLLELGKAVKEQGGEGFSVFTLNPYGIKALSLRTGGGETHKTEFPPYVGYDVDDEHKKNGSNRHVLKALEKLLSNLEEAIKAGFEQSVYMEDAHNDRTFYLEKDVATSVYELLAAFYQWGNRLKRENFQRGKNLLMGLQSGDITLKDFEES